MKMIIDVRRRLQRYLGPSLLPKVRVTIMNQVTMKRMQEPRAQQGKHQLGVIIMSTRESLVRWLSLLIQVLEGHL